jgi:hypothetical protein
VTRARKLQDGLSYPPRAMKAERAAAYLDMSRSKFLELVEAQRLPKPKIIDGIRVIGSLLIRPSMISQIAVMVITLRAGTVSTTC